jgi:dephospho-CoA kinase
MIKVGLSGNRFAGKDRVAKIFKSIGIPVFDVDVIIKFILNYSHQTKFEIKTKIGEKYFNKDFTINLPLIDSDNRFGDVLKLIEPEIFKSYHRFESKNKDSIYTIFNCGVLYETLWDKKMDKNITVYAPFIDRVERAKDSKFEINSFLEVAEIPIYDSNYRTCINKLLVSEMSEFDKNGHANHVIHNYNEFNLEDQVMKIDQIIIDYYIGS